MNNPSVPNHTPRAAHPPAHPSRHLFGASVIAALILNIAALGAMVMAVSRWQAVTSVPSERTAWVTTLMLPESALPAPPPMAPEPAIPAAPQRLIKPTAQAPATAAPRQGRPEPTSIGSGTAVRFFRTTEVERPAEPATEWNLDTGALDTAGIERLVFDVFVDREGNIVRCEVREPSDLPDDTRREFEARLRQTALLPARRGDMPVPSVRRIELTVLPPLQP